MEWRGRIDHAIPGCKPDEVIQRLPDYAENHFATLCAEAGVVCNASKQDEFGWDFFVQYPALRDPTKPADRQPAGVEALVQVKSTRAAPFVTRLKLSNALHAAQARQPFFVVLVVAGGDVQTIYAKHFWHDEIERTLKRVRLAENAGDTKFNRRHFDIRMDAADNHSTDLLDWMRSTIIVQKDYGAAKSEIFDTVGHENGWGLMNVTYTGTEQEMLDLQLGLIDSLPLTRLRYVPQRFGIAAAQPEYDVEHATLSVTPVGKPATLRMQGGSPTGELMIDAMFYDATLPDGDQVHFRWRVDAGPLRIVGGAGRYQANVSMRYDEHRSLLDLGIYLKLASWRAAGPIGLQLFLNNQRVPLGSMTIDPKVPDADWPVLLRWTETLQTLAKSAHAAHPEISIVELDDADPYLPRFVEFVVNPAIRMEYQPAGTGEPPRSALYYIGCNVGDWGFLALIERPTMSETLPDGRCRVNFGAPRLLDTVVRPGPWRDHQSEIEEAYRAQIDRLGDPDTLWELDYLEDFITRVTASPG
jgi:hypothetical protein